MDLRLTPSQAPDLDSCVDWLWVIASEDLAARGCYWTRQARLGHSPCLPANAAHCFPRKPTGSREGDCNRFGQQGWGNHATPSLRCGGT